MAKKKSNPRETIKMKSTESTDYYWTTKNKRNTPARLERKKFDKVLRRHVVYREGK